MELYQKSDVSGWPRGAMDHYFQFSAARRGANAEGDHSWVNANLDGPLHLHNG